MTQFSIRSNLNSYEIVFYNTGEFSTLRVSGKYDDTGFEVIAMSKGEYKKTFRFQLADCPVLRGMLTDLHTASLSLKPLMEQIEGAVVERSVP